MNSTLTTMVQNHNKCHAHKAGVQSYIHTPSFTKIILKVQFLYLVKKTHNKLDIKIKSHIELKLYTSLFFFFPFFFEH